MRGSGNQYARSAGDVKLVEALAKHYSPLMNRSIAPLTEIAVSVGATGVLYAVMQGLLDEGDEVIVLEPAFDIYAAQIQLAQATAVYVPLRVEQQSPGNKEVWKLDMIEFEAAFTSRTRMVIINTPHNPTGKVNDSKPGLIISLTPSLFVGLYSRGARGHLSDSSAPSAGHGSHG